MEAFVAHDDIEVSEERQLRIREELSRCHLFVPLLSKNFLESQWTLQEVGIIASLADVKIAPLSIDGVLPFGFISHFQSSRIRSDGITCQLLVEPLAKHFPFSERDPSAPDPTRRGGPIFSGRRLQDEVSCAVV